MTQTTCASSKRIGIFLSRSCSSSASPAVCSPEFRADLALFAFAVPLAVLIGASSPRRMLVELIKIQRSQLTFRHGAFRASICYTAGCRVCRHCLFTGSFSFLFTWRCPFSGTVGWFLVRVRTCDISRRLHCRRTVDRRCLFRRRSHEISTSLSDRNETMDLETKGKEKNERADPMRADKECVRFDQSQSILIKQHVRMNLNW